MKKTTTGAWLVHHSKKLDLVQATGQFDKVELAGKAGRLLALISENDETTLSQEQLSELARSASISPAMELPVVISHLEQQQLLDRSVSGVAVVGLTTTGILRNSASIFESLEPSAAEQASITVAESASSVPLSRAEAIAAISDTHQVASREAANLASDFAEHGFVDLKRVGETDAPQDVFYNGKVFEVDNAKKVAAILDGLTAADRAAVQTIENLLERAGCVPLKEVAKHIAKETFVRLQDIGVYEVSSISNERGKFDFVTKPSSFSKFSNSAELQDAFDDARALVSSLSYGMIYSPSSRGQIQLLERLLGKLISGQSVGPATAIGSDYKVLEVRKVLRTWRPPGDSRYMMKLLRKEIGSMALAVLRQTADETGNLDTLALGPANRFVDPEKNRVASRKTLSSDGDARRAARLLEHIRTGGFK